MKRIGYIDALRGLTMILVVFSHLYIPNRTIINQLFINFRMPLFFFISGLISMRIDQEWNGGELRRRLGSKARTLLLPVLIFGTLYSFARGFSFDEFIFHERKLGYWFTLVLFEMLSIYYTLRYTLSRRADTSHLGRAVVVLFIFAVALSFLWSERWTEAPLPTLFSFSCLLRFLPFFTFGLMAGYYRKRFDRLVDYWSVYLGAIVLFGVLSWARMTWDDGIDVVLCLLVGFAGIVMMYGTFRRLHNHLEATTLIGRSMQYVGRHTLEVYVIHYFLLIGFGAMLQPYVAASAFPLSPAVIGLPLAVAIAVASLGIGWLLCRSKFIAYYALGKR